MGMGFGVVPVQGARPLSERKKEEESSMQRVQPQPGNRSDRRHGSMHVFIFNWGGFEGE